MKYSLERDYSFFVVAPIFPWSYNINLGLYFKYFFILHGFQLDGLHNIEGHPLFETSLKLNETTLKKLSLLVFCYVKTCLNQFNIVNLWNVFQYRLYQSLNWNQGFNCTKLKQKLWDYTEDLRHSMPSITSRKIKNFK